MPPIDTKEVFALTGSHYAGIFAPPITLPTRKEMFDYQVELLVAQERAKYVHADPFRNQLDGLPNDRFLFVPPPPDKFDLAALMAGITLNGKTGVNYLTASALKDLVALPKTASLLVDVEDGGARRNVKPMDSRANIESEGRLPFGTWRGIVFATVFPWVLNDHFLDLVGSQYDEGYVPCLDVLGKKPALCGLWEDIAGPQCGAPSAGSVIIVP